VFSKQSTRERTEDRVREEDGGGGGRDSKL